MPCKIKIQLVEFPAISIGRRVEFKRDAKKHHEASPEFKSSSISLISLTTLLVLVLIATQETRAFRRPSDADTVDRVVGAERFRRWTRMDEIGDHDEVQEIGSDPALRAPLYEFAGKLFKSINKGQDSNLIMSPLSISFALSMLSLGASEGSETERILRETLAHDHLPNMTSESFHEANRKLLDIFRTFSTKTEATPVLDMINFVISKHEIGSDYQKDVDKYYKASSLPSPIKSAQTPEEQSSVLEEIKRWSEEAGLSGDIITEEELRKSSMVLLNGLRVESSWLIKFGLKKVPELFFNNGRRDSVVRNRNALVSERNVINYVEFTKKTSSSAKSRALSLQARVEHSDHYDKLANYEFRAINIQLERPFSYTIIEPLKAGHGELAKLEKRLFESSSKSKWNKLNMIMAIVDAAERAEANITMPPFKFSKQFGLKEPLKSIGLNRIFAKNEAEFNRMGKDYHVDEVKHEAMVEVNKYGIKAAAATAIMAVKTASEPNWPVMLHVEVKNPFLFMIRLHKVPMFIGHLMSI